MAIAPLVPSERARVLGTSISSNLERLYEREFYLCRSRFATTIRPFRCGGISHAMILQIRLGSGRLALTAHDKRLP